MIKNLEQNYISVIIVVNDEKKDIIEKINKINLSIQMRGLFYNIPFCFIL